MQTVFCFLALLLVFSIVQDPEIDTRKSGGPRKTVNKEEGKKAGGKKSESGAKATTHKSITGRVISDSGTSLTVKPSGSTSPVIFTYNKETKVSGEIEDDAIVTVEYKESGGKKIAVAITVK